MFTITHTKKKFYFDNPRIEDIDIEDIAHSLSQLCRFTGHTKFFYSVAEHSLWVSKLVPPEYALWGLLHDAAEAYIGDLSHPLKKLINGKYRALEESIMGVIVEKFSLHPKTEPRIVRTIDRALTLKELNLLVDEDYKCTDKYKDVVGLPDGLDCLDNIFAKFLFLCQFDKLEREDGLTSELGGG